MKREITIDGSHIIDKTSLYKEFNKKLMPNEDWTLAESLDALNDVFYGDFGEIKGDEPVKLIWTDFNKMNDIFGYNFTLDFYENKLKYPEQFETTVIQNSIDELKNGTGKTYLEIILEIIADHPNIELIKN